VESEREMLIGIQKEPRTHPHDGNGKWEMGTAFSNSMKIEFM
jgi:hypothetical protein